MRKIIQTDQAPAPVGPYNQDIVASGALLFVAGQIPLDAATGELVGATVAAQTEKAIQNLTADYSPESHSLDLDRYVSVVQRRRRRAKALVDFDRHDHDELGFKKNDVINVCICHIAPSIFLCLFLSISF